MAAGGDFCARYEYIKNGRSFISKDRFTIGGYMRLIIEPVPIRSTQ